MSNTRELGLHELEEVSGAGVWDEYGAARAAHAPTQAEWTAIGKQLSAIYIADHPPHLGQPLKK